MIRAMEHHKSAPALPSPRLTRNAARTLLAEHDASGLSGKFARQHGIAVETIYRWRSKFKPHLLPIGHLPGLIRSLTLPHRFLTPQGSSQRWY